MAENEQKTPKKFGGFFKKEEEEKGGVDKKGSQKKMTPFKTTPSPFGGNCPVSYEEDDEEKKDE